MKSRLAEFKPLLPGLAVFSLFINLLAILPALFAVQVFERALPGNSNKIPLVLIIGVGVALGIPRILDHVRLRLQYATASITSTVRRARRPMWAIRLGE
jgi:ABC-type protease/lipase transport system fused ATPase/permease subunit